MCNQCSVSLRQESSQKSSLKRSELHLGMFPLHPSSFRIFFVLIKWGLAHDGDGAKQRVKLLAAWRKDLEMNFGKLEKQNSTKIWLDHKEWFGNSLQMSRGKLEEQPVNIPYEMSENSPGHSPISISQCHVCFGAFKEKLCFPCPVNSPYKIFLDAPRAE